MRRLFLLLILLGISASATANVSLGELQVRSSLNQPLEAQFRAEGSALAGDEVEIRLASAEAYRRFGLPRAAVPEDLTISIEGSGTSRVVLLSTQRPVGEPYVGLLLEASWGSGRVLREYTILLDPPVAFAPERSAAPAISRTPQPETRDAPAAPARAETGTVADTYSVRSGDTLAAIVRRQGYTGVTDQQAMLAIRDANPGAFIGGNINQLRAGARLTLPGQAEVAGYSRQEALEEFRRQTAEWRERTAPTRAVATEEPASEAVAETSAEAEPPPPEAVAEAEPEPAADPAAASEELEEAPPDPAADGQAVVADAEAAVTDRLEILGEDAFEAMAVAGTGEPAIEEAVLSQQVAVGELQDELSSLRTELEERDQRISMMNTELARLEEQMQALRAERDEELLGSGAAGAPLHQRLLADPLLLLLAATSVLLFLLLLVSVFRTRRSESAYDVPVSSRGGVAPARSAPAAADRAVPASEEAASRTMAATGAGSVVGAAGVAAAQRDERPADEGFAGPGEEVDVGEEKADDILADVDLYLAYGMNDQAIAALEGAIRDGREDPEYRVRLIEAHAANEDGDAVRREAEAVRGELGPGQDALRERVAVAESRFPQPETTDEVAVGGNEEDAASGPDALEKPLTFDLSGESDEPAGKGGEPREEEDEYRSLRFDLDDPEDGAATAGRLADADRDPDGLPELTLPDLEPMDQEGSDRPGADAGSDNSENGMKLSLAEAFVEMGDRDGALGLLEEITPTATDAQKAKVEEIRRQIEGGDG
ncbi:FimV/HubP family polar landmark protein [Thioalkalivibrio sp.]|uniref:FimV/HubP family polar landmark protein n=1 Tax=Thioalkalivibrio sp. TaxID=2093813 RepID=UPI003566E9D0